MMKFFTITFAVILFSLNFSCMNDEIATELGSSTSSENKVELVSEPIIKVSSFDNLLSFISDNKASETLVSNLKKKALLFEKNKNNSSRSVTISTDSLNYLIDTDNVFHFEKDGYESYTMEAIKIGEDNIDRVYQLMIEERSGVIHANIYGYDYPFLSSESPVLTDRTPFEGDLKELLNGNNNDESVNGRRSCRIIQTSDPCSCHGTHASGGCTHPNTSFVLDCYSFPSRGSSFTGGGSTSSGSDPSYGGGTSGSNTSSVVWSNNTSVALYLKRKLGVSGDEYSYLRDSANSVITKKIAFYIFDELYDNPSSSDKNKIKNILNEVIKGDISKSQLSSIFNILIRVDDDTEELNTMMLYLILNQNTKITYSELLKNFENIRYSHFKPNGEAYFDNYCAINLSHALLKSGVKINSSSVTKCYGCTDVDYKG